MNLSPELQAELDEFVLLTRQELEEVKATVIRQLPESMRRGASFSSDQFAQCVAGHIFLLEERAEECEAGFLALYWLYRNEKRQKETLRDEMRGAVFPVVHVPSLDSVWDNRPVIDDYSSLPVPERLEAILSSLCPYLNAMGNAKCFEMRVKTAVSKEIIYPCYQVLRERVGKETWWRKGEPSGKALLDVDKLEVLPNVEYWHISREVVEKKRGAS